MSPKPATNRLSIYLIKEEYSKPEDILKDPDQLKSTPIGDIGVLYFGESHNFRPSWIDDFFGPTLGKNIRLFSASSKAILLTTVNVTATQKRVFAIPFGYGWTFLAHGVFEERFGLRVTLNTIDPDNLRRIQKKNLSSVPKDSDEQLSKEGAAADFGIDIEQDLIQSVTGKTRVEAFGKTITGKDSLTVSTKVDLPNLQEFLKSSYENFVSKEYRKNFAWIDQISEIKNATIIKTLNDKLVENIKNNNLEKIWMAVPELLDWADVSGFAYKNSKADLKNDINLTDFLSQLPETSRNNLDLEAFNRRIFCFGAASDELKHEWKAYNCLYCEIQDEQKTNTYLLSNGKWYRVEVDFAKQVNADYRQLRDGGNPCNLPDYKSKNENEYNENVASSDDAFCCMDKKVVSHGGGYSKIEFCDLFTKDNKIVHVKQYGGSAVLSHLFSQGIVSGELFLSDMDFRNKVNDKLPRSHKIDNPNDKPNAAKYAIIFAIISSSPKELEIPFFSKVTLKNARRRLETYGYKVYLQKIEARTK